MYIVLKSLAGVDYPLRNENGVVVKTISLKGGCYLNNVNNDDYKELVKQYPSFLQMIEEDFAVVSETPENAQKNVDDTLQKVKNKQDKAKNKASNAGVDVKEGV